MNENEFRNLLPRLSDEQLMTIILILRSMQQNEGTEEPPAASPEKSAETTE